MLTGLVIGLCALYAVAFFAHAKWTQPTTHAVICGTLPAVSLTLGALLIYGTLPPVSLWAIALLSVSGPIAAATTYKTPLSVQRAGTFLAALFPLAALILPADPIRDLAPQPNTLVLSLVAFVCASAALGFFLRAALLTDHSLQLKYPSWPSPLHLISALSTFLALRSLSLLGASLSTPHLPIIDSDGQPAHWVLELDIGLPIATPVPELSGLFLAAIALPLITAFIPKSRAFAFASILSCAIALAPILWIFSLQGDPVELNPEDAKALLTRLKAAASLVESPLYLGSKPFTISTLGVEGPLVLLCAASGFSLLGTFGWNTPSPTPETPIDPSTPEHVLRSRVALQAGGALLVASLVFVLITSFMLLGVWGPQSTREHALTAVTLFAMACTFGLHGLPADTYSVRNALLRAFLTALPIAALFGLFAGGLFTSLSWFQLS